MELDPRVKSLARRVLPAWLVRRLDPAEARIAAVVADFGATRPAGARVLDAGCGENRFRAHFAHCRLIGYDRRVGDPRWDYSRVDVVGDLHRLALRTGCLDAAISVVTLEHLARPAEALAELARALKRRGELLLVVPLLWEVHQAPHDYFRFTRHGIAHLLESAGFEIERCEPLGGFFVLMARRCVSTLAFFQSSWRWVLFALLAPWLGILMPLLLGAIDGLDQRQDFTLGYTVRARRTDGPGPA
jgi:SAM-dependent methyltransferase